MGIYVIGFRPSTNKLLWRIRVISIRATCYKEDSQYYEKVGSVDKMFHNCVNI